MIRGFVDSFMPSRLFRFRLRSLLLLVLLAAIGLGVPLYRAEQRRRTAAHLTDLGATLVYDYQLDEFNNQIPNATPPGPKWVQQVFGPDLLASVRLVWWHSDKGPSISDTDLRQLIHHPRLKSLLLPKSPLITNDGLHSVSQLTDLEGLVLDNLPQTTDAALESLARLNKLQNFVATRMPWNGSGFARFPNKSLEWLNLSDCAITNEGLLEISRITSLRTLELQRTQISDPGLVHLASLANLETLDLWGNNVTDAGIQHLVRLSNLKRLILMDTTVTKDSADALSRGLPNCRMDCPFGFFYPDGRGWDWIKTSE
jgi:hypothetical protein